MLVAIALPVAETVYSIEQRQGLSSPASSELTFELDDEEYLFQRLATEADCRIDFEGAVTEPRGRCRAFVTVDGARPEQVRTLASKAAAVESVSVASETADGGRLELLLATPLLGVHFPEYVVEVSHLHATPDAVEVTLAVARPENVRDIATAIRERYPDAKLLSKRSRSGVGSDHERFLAFQESLTPRQREVVQTAYLSGYFDSPRQCTGEELGEKLGISSQAVYQHIRSAQRKLFEEAFHQHHVTPMQDE
jgi:DNA-binding CsgD family transcriptional regulator